MKENDNQNNHKQNCLWQNLGKPHNKKIAQETVIANFRTQNKSLDSKFKTPKRSLHLSFTGHFN